MARVFRLPRFQEVQEEGALIVRTSPVAMQSELEVLVRLSHRFWTPGMSSSDLDTHASLPRRAKSRARAHISSSQLVPEPLGSVISLPHQLAAVIFFVFFNIFVIRLIPTGMHS